MRVYARPGLAGESMRRRYCPAQCIGASAVPLEPTVFQFDPGERGPFGGRADDGDGLDPQAQARLPCRDSVQVFRMGDGLP
jgi:hypothetical protein